MASRPFETEASILKTWIPALEIPAPQTAKFPSLKILDPKSVKNPGCRVVGKSTYAHVASLDHKYGKWPADQMATFSQVTLA